MRSPTEAEIDAILEEIWDLMPDLVEDVVDCMKDPYYGVYEHKTQGVVAIKSCLESIVAAEREGQDNLTIKMVRGLVVKCLLLLAQVNTNFNRPSQTEKMEEAL